MRMRTLTLAALPLAALAFAESTRSEDPPEPPSAELVIVSGTSGIAATSWIARYTTEACDNGQRLANFNFLKRGEKKVKVPVGQRLYLLGYAHIEKPVGAENVGKSTCRGMASFVPEAGKAYQVTHDLKERNCPLLIADASGAQTPTYQKHKATGPCKKVD